MPVGEAARLFGTIFLLGFACGAVAMAGLIGWWIVGRFMDGGLIAWRMKAGHEEAPAKPAKAGPRGVDSG